MLRFRRGRYYRHSFAEAQNRYLKAKGDFIRSNAAALDKAGLTTFWDGYGTNANAALTVFRHNDSATVVQSLVGTPPTSSHQLMTRMYMDFLRMESEMNFLGFLPQEQRLAEVNNWYRGADRSVHAYLASYYEHGVLPPPFDFKTNDPKAELLRALQARLAKVLNHRYRATAVRAVGHQCCRIGQARSGTRRGRLDHATDHAHQSQRVWYSHSIVAGGLPEQTLIRQPKRITSHPRAISSARCQ